MKAVLDMMIDLLCSDLRQNIVTMLRAVSSLHSVQRQCCGDSTGRTKSLKRVLFLSERKERQEGEDLLSIKYDEVFLSGRSELFVFVAARHNSGNAYLAYGGNSAYLFQTGDLCLIQTYPLSGILLCFFQGQGDTHTSTSIFFAT